MGGVSPEGKLLWLAGHYTTPSTRTGKVIATIPVGVSRHGLCAGPQPDPHRDRTHSLMR